MHCWMSIEGGMMFSFIVPVSLLIMVSKAVGLVEQFNFCDTKRNKLQFTVIIYAASRPSTLFSRTNVNFGSSIHYVIYGHVSSHHPSFSWHLKDVMKNIRVTIFSNTVTMLLILKRFFAYKPITHKIEIERVEPSLRSGVSLLPFFAVNWFLSVLALEDTATNIFQYLFSFCNLIQHLLIFLFHCYQRPEEKATGITQNTRIYNLVN
uniref:G-protein coupled receptors family 2 profile 2 domain-containing protein n=1 Tax=Tetranychus urticae TaxID=32264 RepID=T1KTJ5_TETUR